MKRTAPKSIDGYLNARGLKIGQLVWLYISAGQFWAQFSLIERVRGAVRLVVTQGGEQPDNKILDLYGWYWPHSYILTDEEAAVTLAKLALGVPPAELFKELPL